jgi:hypothetical protein
MGRRIPVDPSTAEGKQAHAIAELGALASRLPVTGCDGGPPWSGTPIADQLRVRDEARDLLASGEVSLEAVDRLWARLPRYWRRQFS